MAIPSQFLDEVKHRTGLSDVVGRRVRLAKKGHEHSGLCPFHKEKTPSFTVNESKGFYHCFGCGAHGSVFDFVMETEGLNFREAVEKLAGEAGLSVPQERPEDRAREERRKTLYDVTEAAALFFQSQLGQPTGAGALEYLKDRGLTNQTLSDFRLGFAPDRRDGLKAALIGKDGITEEMLLGAGLIIQPEDRNRASYDRFRGRVIFPILDRRGRVVAFGGRILGDGEPKYLNSPETDLFHKGRLLYAMEKAQVAARSGQALIVTEGYMDAIALNQAGFEGAVAPLGTALTEDQLVELWKVAPEPVLCFDGDNAGVRAMARASERALGLIKPGLGLRFASLPSGEDPDTLVRGQGADAFKAILDAAQPLSEVLWQMEAGNADTNTPEGRAGLQKNLEEHARRIEDPTLRAHFLANFKDRIWARREGGSGGQGGGSGNTFRKKSGRGGWPGRAQPNRNVFAPGEGTNALKQAKVEPSRKREEILIVTLITHPELFDDLCERFGSLSFYASDLDNLRQEALKTLAGDQALDAEGLQGHLRQSGYAEILDHLLSSKGLQNAFFARPDADMETALEGWEETYTLYRQSDLRAEILEAQQLLAAEKSAEASERLRILKSQEHGAVTKNAK